LSTSWGQRARQELPAVWYRLARAEELPLS
jgi:hypothetical protein